MANIKIKHRLVLFYLTHIEMLLVSVVYRPLLNALKQNLHTTISMMCSKEVNNTS